MSTSGLQKQAISAALALLFIAAPATAEPVSFTNDYTITFLGLPVARSTFTGTFNGDDYSVSGELSSAGLAKLFDSTTGTTSIKGRFVGDATRPNSFRTQYKSGKKSQLTAITFSGGKAVKTVNDPPLKKRPNKVPVQPDHLRAVVDPLSATLIRAESLAEVCNRTLNIYDGELRMNLALTPAKIGPINGVEAATCSGRFTPISGYRKDNRSIQYMKSRARISISFAQVGQTGIYAPVRATVSTTMGPVTVTSRAR